MRREMIWAGGLFACVLAVAIGVRAAESVPVNVKSDSVENAVIMMGDVRADQLVPLPETYTVTRRYPDGHPMQNALAGAVESCALEETKEIYSSKLGTFGFKPGRGQRIADDLITELVRECTICSLRVRVSGGVEDGDDVFLADFSLYDACPASGEGGQEIPGTRLRFSNLEDDAGQFHDLILDYSDRGICDDNQRCLVSQQNCRAGTCTDGSACNTNNPACEDKSPCVSSGFVCVEDPLQIPATVWVRLRFDTDDAIVVMGSPPTRGFSADAYDDPQAHCTAWFAGWPVFPHATIFAEILAPAPCQTHFLAYLAANPNKPAFLPSQIGPIPLLGGGTRQPITTPTTRLGDDITLTVEDCTLSAYELGMKGNVGEFTMDIDLRWPNVTSIKTDTVVTFTGRGEGSTEVGHFTIDEDVSLSININDQPIHITWKANKANTGAIEVNITQAGTSDPDMVAFDVDFKNPDRWISVPDGDFSPAVFYAAIFCRGDAPRGACCPNQAAIPGRDMNCFDDVPVTSCLGTRWQINSTCEQNLFNPECGTHSCCLPPPNQPCNNRTFDDCVEECITDVDPIFCEPVCNGGPNHRLPCNDDADCDDPDGPDDGICDPDALCPGQRTCGVTGCQLNGEFTGRPCDLNNPNQGASDCMTCSSSGDYCRPRCTAGLRRGRPCDDDTDCPGTGSTCDNDFDCFGSQCGQAQTCVDSDSQCSLRCARWGSGKFCGLGDQFCPNFTCFDAVGDCFDAEGELVCFGRCSVTRNCSSDSNCEPDFGTCLPSGQCSGFECFRPDQCEPNLGECVQSDVDCPLGTRCLMANRICTGREGCDNLECCGAVCGDKPECCDGAVGEAWTGSCVSKAESVCTFPPGNDECHSNSPNEGAFEITLDDDITGTVCTSASESCSARKGANNDFASSDLSDPGFCCNERGVDVGGAGTIWFKFTAAHDSALIHTCDTEGSATTVNSMIQVFKALEHSDDGTDLDECNSLEVIACNDDSGCGQSGENCEGGGCMAGICVVGLNRGEIYYIMMAASQGSNQGGYDIAIESPCPSGTEPPAGSICEFAANQPLPDGPAGVPFDLADGSLDCPAEGCLPGMINDVWYLAQASCVGNLIVQTCGFGESNPDTTLAVYSTIIGGGTCPPTNLVGCNDDATIRPVCSLGGDVCEVDEDCNLGCSGTGEQCKSDSDCPGTSTCDPALRAVCETMPEGFGDSSETECQNDSECNRGVCENNLVTRCDASRFGSCTGDGSACDGVVSCADGSDCAPECPFNAAQNRQWECLLQESCVIGECRSECAPGSYVVIPTFATLWYLVRVGGEFGSEPSGTVRLSCEQDDCQPNGVPDLIDIETGLSSDCNRNNKPDECELRDGLSNDCNCNDVPDECEIDEEIPAGCAIVGDPCADGPFFCSDLDPCDPDVNRNGIPDCCDEGVEPAVCPQCPVECGIASVTGVVFADADPIAPLTFDQPDACSIDAREPHEIGNAAVRFGWDRMVMSFSCDPAPIGIGAGDFAVRGVPDVPVPGVASVDIVGDTATVVLDDTITPGQWTCIEYVPSGDEWCMGYLPADAGQDGVSAATDINKLIDSINLVVGAELPIYATDINRSGVTTGEDILRLIDLLNGAGDFDVWLTETLPACPSP